MIRCLLSILYTEYMRALYALLISVCSISTVYGMQCPIASPVVQVRRSASALPKESKKFIAQHVHDRAFRRLRVLAAKTDEWRRAYQKKWFTGEETHKLVDITNVRMPDKPVSEPAVDRLLLNKDDYSKKYNTILTDEEKESLAHNLEQFGILSLDDSLDFLSNLKKKKEVRRSDIANHLGMLLLASLMHSISDNASLKLIQLGADVDYQYLEPDMESRTLLMLAASGEIGLRYALKKPFKRDDAIQNQVELAEQITKRLLQAGADPNIQSSTGNTALRLAAENGYEPVVRLLLEYGANPNTQDMLGKTAFIIAKKFGNTKTAALLRDAMEAS